MGFNSGFKGLMRCEVQWHVVGYSFQALLGAFPKLRKGTVSFVIFVRIEQLRSYWTDFYEILYLSIFRKKSREIQVSL